MSCAPIKFDWLPPIAVLDFCGVVAALLLAGCSVPLRFATHVRDEDRASI
jgi:hypothetical protein